MKRKSISFYIFAERADEGVIRAVKNVYDFVDELIVRLDEKKEGAELLEEIDRQSKIKIFPQKFTDFADVRNFALSKVTGDWVLTLDSDEIFSRALLNNLARYVEDEKFDGYKFNRIHFYKSKEEARDPFQHLRLFRKTKGVKYTGSVHELLEGVERIYKCQSWKSVILHFNKYRDMVSKNKRYHAILEEELKLAKKGDYPQLVELAKFRLWCNENIDNPEHFKDLEKMSDLKQEFELKLKQVLKGRKHYHHDLAKLEHLRLETIKDK
jgi:glycosyltransferase involved in cell wall biosynthesis